ncbi:PRC-barrel domain protein [uncultured archaeon]|jgi:sporulation protein YlmC with PRC-barrel domain|nr:PRC-barrel domain protein [uncultured archaeon]
MVKLLLARQLAGRKLITNDGEEVGRLVDIVINEKNGRLETLVVEPNPDNLSVRKMRKEEGFVYVPYTAILAASDYVIVDKKNFG